MLSGATCRLSGLSSRAGARAAGVVLCCVGLQCVALCCVPQVKNPSLLLQLSKAPPSRHGIK